MAPHGAVGLSDLLGGGVADTALGGHRRGRAAAGQDPGGKILFKDTAASGGDGDDRRAFAVGDLALELPGGNSRLFGALVVREYFYWFYHVVFAQLHQGGSRIKKPAGLCERDGPG